MERMARKSSWEWSRTAQTRKSMLQAAREVFSEHGFADSNVSEVVARAGSSVGSLYHHFGGKAELFTALWERYRDEQHTAAAAGVAAARADGVTEPFALFEAGARAYMLAAWGNRDMVRLFYDGDSPPGFQKLLRHSGKKWVQDNFKLLGANDSPVNRVLVALLTSFMGDARREVASARSSKEARQMVETMMAVLARLRTVIEADLMADAAR
jgi:AcrR family transcriptional regulator